MGQVLIKLGDLASAERFLARALLADAGYAPAHLHLGLAYLLQGEGQSAQEQLLLAQSLDPGSATARQAQRLLEGGSP
jgi:Tfp pilus assembly protein PilF